MAESNRVIVFSSIESVASSMKEHTAEVPIEVVQDAALGGYGGTVEFDPTQLQQDTIEKLRQAEILISEPAVVAKLLTSFPDIFDNLKWCQSTYAGVDPLLPVQPRFAVTRFAGKFGPPIAEWCIARIVGHERQFAATARDQEAQVWGKTGNSYRYLSDLTLVILGCGDIGLCIGKAAKAFGMRVVGYATSYREADGLDDCVIDLKSAISQADYIVSVLPSTAQTKGLLSLPVLEAGGVDKGGKSPVFINVGRGSVISESTLVRALDDRYISAAILDVFEVEPLPTESPLWRRSDVVASPHVCGLTRAADVPDIFIKNYRRFRAGEPLLYQVDFSKGY